jgi:hypothetical protein
VNAILWGVRRRDPSQLDLAAELAAGDSRRTAPLRRTCHAASKSTPGTRTSTSHFKKDQ